MHKSSTSDLITVSGHRVKWWIRPCPEKDGDNGVTDLMWSHPDRDLNERSENPGSQWVGTAFPETADFYGREDVADLSRKEVCCLASTQDLQRPE